MNSCVPRTAHEADASLFGEGDPRQGAADLCALDFHAAKSASQDFLLTAKVLDDGVAVCRELDRVLCVTLGLDASQNVAPLFGVFHSPPETAIDV